MKTQWIGEGRKTRQQPDIISSPSLFHLAGFLEQLSISSAQADFAGSLRRCAVSRARLFAALKSSFVLSQGRSRSPVTDPPPSVLDDVGSYENETSGNRFILLRICKEVKSSLLRGYDTARPISLSYQVEKKDTGPFPKCLRYSAIFVQKATKFAPR